MIKRKSNKSLSMLLIHILCPLCHIKHWFITGSDNKSSPFPRVYHLQSVSFTHWPLEETALISNKLFQNHLTCWYHRYFMGNYFDVNAIWSIDDRLPLLTHIFVIFGVTRPKWIKGDLMDTAWCRQATSHYCRQCFTILWTSYVYKAPHVLHFCIRDNQCQNWNW